MFIRSALGLTILAAAVAWLTALATTGGAVQPVTVAIGSLSLDVGKQGSVNLEILNIPSRGVGSWTVDVTYNPAVVSVARCQGLGASVCNPQFVPDAIRVAGATPAPLMGDSTLAIISFQCDREGVSPVRPQVTVLADGTRGDPRQIDAATKNGSIACGPVAVTPAPTRMPVPGDVDCSGAANSVDAALLLQFEAHLLLALPCAHGADIQKDGRMNSLDASLILQFHAGLLDTLPP